MRPSEQINPGAVGGSGAGGASSASSPIKVDGLYAKYVLAVLTLVYVFNFLDRQILAILAEEIKADLSLSDSQLGFLFGTAFAVFYATFGIVLGRLADVWSRTKLISVGICLWSLMTVCSGFARGFLPLAICRFGVAAGEASATPTGISLLYDCFSPKIRTTILAIYSGGLYIGMGLGLFLGGAILGWWNDAWPQAGTAPFGLKGWQAAFLIVGVPGLLVAVLTATLREPLRGIGDGAITAPHSHPFQEALQSLLSMLPILNWAGLAERGGVGAVRLNAVAGIATISFAYGLIVITGDAMQWIALGVGVYATLSWLQAMAVRDPVIIKLIFGCRTLRNMILAGGVATYMGVALQFWSIPYFLRVYEVDAEDLAMVLGPGAAIFGMSGILIGGYLADRFRAITPRGKLFVWLAGVSLSIVFALVFLLTNSLTIAYIGILGLYFSGPMAQAPALATINDLMLPRGRAMTSALAFMVATFVGVALGPYLTGHLSDLITATGVGSGIALKQAMLWSLLLPVAGLILIIRVVPHVKLDEDSLVSRARFLGEKI